MKLSADELRELAELPPATCRAFLKLLAARAEKEDARREKDAERKRTIRGQSADKAQTIRGPSSPSRSFPIPLSNSPSPSVKPRNKTRAREELELVLDAEHAEAVLEHRKALRKPLTPFAAKLLAGKLAQCDDPNAGAEAMVENGWQGFKPEWLDRLNGKHGPPKRSPMMQAAEEIMRETREKYGNTTDKAKR